MSLDLEAGLDWRAKVELFEQIRREYEFGAGTIIGICAQAGGAPADGARSGAERNACAEEEDRTTAGEDGRCI